MATILTVNGKSPEFGDNCFIAQNATIVGNVVMGNDCSVWFNAVIRGDVHYIKMGDKVNVQDGAVIHCTYEKNPTNIGEQRFNWAQRYCAWLYRTRQCADWNGRNCNGPLRNSK